MAEEKIGTLDNSVINGHHIFLTGRDSTTFDTEYLMLLINGKEINSPKSQICCDAMNRVRGTMEDHYYEGAPPVRCHVSVYHITYCSNCGAIWSYNLSDSYDHYHQ